MTDEPRATVPPPESPVPALTVTDELVRPVLFRVPVMFGVNVSAPFVGTIF